MNWLDPAWQAEAHAWIHSHTRVTGEITQPHVRPWSTAMRVPSAGGTVWFKATGPGIVYEAALVETLGALVPDAVLVPIAVDATRGWTLSPDGGRTLREATAGANAEAHWERLLPRYAELQRELAGRADDLVALGVPDLRPGRLPALFARLSGGDARAPQFARWCAELDASGIASSIQHDDLHDANVLVNGDAYRIFDWGDASVGHPFGTLLITLRVLRHKLELPAGDPRLARLRDAYLEPWTGEHDRASLVRVADLAIRVAVVGRALAWERALVDADDAAQAEYGDAVDGWLEAPFEPDLV